MSNSSIIAEGKQLKTRKAIKMVIMKNVQNGIERSIVVNRVFGTTQQVYNLICNYGYGVLNVFTFANAEDAYNNYLLMCGRKGA